MKLNDVLNSKAATSAAGITRFLSHMNTQINTFARQVSGFARWQVFALIAQTGLDFCGCWLGTEISDKFVTLLRERIGALHAVRGKQDKVLLVIGAGLTGWRVAASGDTYTRTHGAQSVTGSITALQAVYGKANVRIGSEKEFNTLAQKMKVNRNSELRAPKKTEAKKTAKKKTATEDGEESEE